MESSSPLPTRVYISQHIRYHDCQIFSIPPFPYYWRLVQWTSPSLGHKVQNASASTEDTSHWSINRWPHPPSLLNISRRHPKCQQHHLLLHRRRRLRLDSRHAKPTPRIPRTNHPTSQQDRRLKPNMHVLPRLRPHVLPRRHGRRHHVPMPSLRPSRRKSRCGLTPALPGPRCSGNESRLPPSSRTCRSRRLGTFQRAGLERQALEDSCAIFKCFGNVIDTQSGCFEQ